MKNLYILMLVLCAFSCSTTEDTQQEIDEDNFATALLNIKVAPNGTINDSLYYTLNNDKIVDYSGYIFYSGSYRAVNKTFDYIGNTLSETNYFYENELSEKDSFTYDEAENLIEVYRESYQTSSYYDRFTFTHTNDTIYRVRYRSLDDGLTEDIVTESKYVFDANDNLTYYDIYSHSIFLLTTIEMDYDANDNMILESRTLYYPNVQTYSNTYTYDYNSLNTLFEINKNSFGKKNYILFHYFDLTDSYWEINPKNICKNSMSSYTSTYEDPIVYTFELSNLLGEEAYAKKNSYKSFIMGDFFSDNIIEYYFD